MSLEADEWDEGWAACRSGVPREENPYAPPEPGSTQREKEIDWYAGWDVCSRNSS